MPLVFQSERFFQEKWPQISQSVESTDAASDVQWIASVTGLDSGASVLDAPCGFGRHSIEFARRGCPTTGVDFSETELGRARKAAADAGVSVTLACQDIRDLEFSGEFDLAVNLFSSIGYFSDDEDRLVLDRFWRALKPGGTFVVDTRNRDQCVRSLPPEERMRRAARRSASRTSSIRPRVAGAPLVAPQARIGEIRRGAEELIGDSEIRLYSAHELLAMLRPSAGARSSSSAVSTAPLLARRPAARSGRLEVVEFGGSPSSKGDPLDGH